MDEADKNNVSEQFLPKKRRAFRTRRISDDESDDEDERNTVKAKIDEMKEIKKMRLKPKGISVITLALGEKVSKEEETYASDPFKAKTGGLVNMSALKSGKVKPVDDAYDTGIGTQFSAETNKRDEDEEMMKYIEVELRKRKGREDAGAEGEGSRYCSPEEAALQAVPDHLRLSSSHRSEEMLSNQMLSGIPEVDLGIEAKIRNIEATEEAKLRLVRASKEQSDGPSFVPTNMAVDFVHHSRFNIDERNKRDRMRPPAQVQGAPSTAATTNSKNNRTEKATDDYHYERFKKQFRRF